VLFTKVEVKSLPNHDSPPPDPLRSSRPQSELLVPILLLNPPNLLKLNFSNHFYSLFQSKSFRPNGTNFKTHIPYLYFYHHTTSLPPWPPSTSTRPKKPSTPTATSSPSSMPPPPTMTAAYAASQFTSHNAIPTPHRTTIIFAPPSQSSLAPLRLPCDFSMSTSNQASGSKLVGMSWVTSVRSSGLSKRIRARSAVLGCSPTTRIGRRSML
jgi:hypothetical protein